MEIAYKDTNQLFTEEEIYLFMEEAIKECFKSLSEGEVPVGCVFVYIPNKRIILRGHNLTNQTKNATTHAEINCINYIADVFQNNEEKKLFLKNFDINEENAENLKELFNKSALFVSCEPCIMCAYALNLVSIDL
jgi:tRNA-specific adenosine deaminase 2